MRIIKRSFLLTLIFIVLSMHFIYASDVTALTDTGEVISINVVPDTAAGTVEICGTLPTTTETDFFLMILKDSSVSLDSINNGNFLSHVEFLIQSTTDQEGNFSVTCLPMTAWNANEHIVYVAYTQKNSQVFSFPTTTIENTIITTVANASSEMIGKLLSGEVLIDTKPLNNYLGLDLSLYLQLADKTSVHASVAGQTFSDVKSISQTLREAMKQRAELEALDRDNVALMQRIKNASESEMIALIESNDAILALDLSGTYGYTYLKSLYDNGDKAPLQSVISKMKASSSISEARTAFQESTIMASINGADWQTIDDVLTAYQTELNITTELNQFNLLSDAKKTNLLQELVIVNFGDKASVKSQFTILITKYSQPVVESGGGGISVSAPMPSPEVTEPVSFRDVPATHWASPSITYLTGKGVLSGYPDGSFQPDKSVSREEFVKILVLSLGLYRENSQCTFTDVGENSWYYPYVASAYENGIVNGKGDHFGSGERITREEAATMIYRCANMFGKSFTDGMEFVDNDSISEFAREAVLAISGTIINGDENGRFNPSGSTTRAQSAKMIYQLLQLN